MNRPNTQLAHSGTENQARQTQTAQQVAMERMEELEMLSAAREETVKRNAEAIRASRLKAAKEARRA